MNKIFQKLLLAGITVVSLTTSSCNSEQTPTKERNEVAVGETFQIKIKENPSTGYENCWVNQKEALAVSLVKKEYKQEGSSDCAGCGGTATFTFKGTAKGTDTIKLVNCPGPRNGTGCEECSEGAGEAKKIIAVVE